MYIIKVVRTLPYYSSRKELFMLTCIKFLPAHTYREKPESELVLQQPLKLLNIDENLWLVQVTVNGPYTLKVVPLWTKK